MTTYIVSVTVDRARGLDHLDVEIDAPSPLEAARQALSTTKGATFVWTVYHGKELVLVQPFAPRYDLDKHGRLIDTTKEQTR